MAYSTMPPASREPLLLSRLTESKRAPRHHVVLRKPRLQKPLTLKIAKRDGKFGIGLDDDNRVVDLKPG